jgi:tRNA dimethylallyltransferase
LALRLHHKRCQCLRAVTAGITSARAQADAPRLQVVVDQDIQPRGTATGGARTARKRGTPNLRAADLSIVRTDPFVWYLAGPTAVGKSAIALELAEQIKGEILSVDSMQLYRGMDFGTAKPSAEERARVPHHLIDIAGLDESFDAARFVAAAQAAESAIRARGRVPVYCGGTGFYFKALLSGVGTAPPPDRSLRAELEAAPIETLLQELQQRDPITFARIDRRNPRRVVRALEVIRLTGRPFAGQQSAWNSQNETPRRLFAFSRGAADLRSRIEVRVERMFAEGLVEETRRLLEQGLADNRTALQAIGYRQVVEHLQGIRSLPETVSLVKTRTWQFARRQATWLRHQLSPTWVSLEEGSRPAVVAARLIRLASDWSAAKEIL